MDPMDLEPTDPFDRSLRSNGSLLIFEKQFTYSFAGVCKTETTQPFGPKWGLPVSDP